MQKLAYGPRGWENDEMQLRAMRGLMIDLLAGRRPMPVADWEKIVAAAKRYPPPPQLE